jgi:hypothetical protein
MRPCSRTEKIGRQALDLNRGRLLCRLLRKEGRLADSPQVVLRLAERLLGSYSYRASGRD